jgi:predicted branched-subunit amino acid permease
MQFGSRPGEHCRYDDDVTRLFPPLDRGSVREGISTMAPATLALAAWGIVTGVAMVKGGLPVGVALVFSLVAYAGTAQLATLPLILVHAPWPVVLVTATFISLRFVIFSAGMRSAFVRLPLRQRLVSAYFQGDLPFVLFSKRFGTVEHDGNETHWGFYYGAGLTCFVVWHIAAVTGILLGSLAPTSWGLDLAAALAIIAVLIPMLTNVPAIVGLIVTSVLAVLTIRVPLRLGLLASIICGLAAALVVETVLDRRTAPLAQPVESS